MNKSFIHIGANKTASTTLQRSLFSRHGGIHYLGEDASSYPEYSAILNSLVSDDDLHYPAEACHGLFERQLRESAGRAFVYSNEDVMTSRVPVLCARRLRDLMPGSRIILVIRNQYTAVPSFYASHGAFLKPAPPGYFNRYVGFDDWMQYQLMFIKYGALAGYYYNRILSVYASLFGADKVHVLFFEDFVQDRQKFVEQLCGIIGIDAGEAMKLLEGKHDRPRVTGRTMVYSRLRSKLFWNVPLARYLPGDSRAAAVFRRFLAAGAPARVELDEKWKRTIFDLYAEDNRALASTYDLPLDRYDYPLA
jgi:hypothetical protein